MVEVVAGIIEREGRILICRRRADQMHALKWEFPGGKVERGEGPSEALARELQEELDLSDVTSQEITRYAYKYPDRDGIQLIFLRVTAFRGEPRNVIFHEMRWEKPEKLAAFDFVEGDRKFLAHYTVAMPAGIKMVDPAQNEFLAGLEGKGKRESHFFRAMAHRPEVLRAFVPLYGAVVGAGTVERRIKELVYLTCSYANQCAYCTAAHTASGQKAGITEEELRALQAEQDHGFSEAERAAIRYARELTRTADAAESRAEFKRHFNDEQMVEITLVAAMANFTNRFNNGLEIRPEN